METPEDFGIRGKLPTHPELLDWLARRIPHESKAGTSRSSQADRHVGGLSPVVAGDARIAGARPGQPLFCSRPALPQLRRGDPRSGTVRRRPAQPEDVRPPGAAAAAKLGLTAAFGGGTDWDNSTGEDKYRRALYTQWRRTTPYPSMTTFDAPSRNVCTVSRPRTNTPLQALVTLNDPVYVEAAQALARGMVKDGGRDRRRNCDATASACA